MEYIRDIDISEAGKNGKTGGTLPISVNFTCKSLYYQRNNNRFVFEAASNEKRYDYSYDYAYGDYGTYERYIENKLREAFASWYDNGHINENDVNTIILKIIVTDGIIYKDGTRFEF